MSEKITVLDKGFVRLADSMGGDLAIVRSARVSYAADWRAGEDEGSDAKLIRYLWKNGHTSPFEAVEMTFEVKAPIFVLRQWHRHRTWSYNEVSARYTKLEEDFYIPSTANITTQSKDNKQARTEEQHHNADHMQVRISEAYDSAMADYLWLLHSGCPRELARMILPVGAYSRMFAKVDLLNLFRFLKLRMHTHAQWEIRQYANALYSLAKTVAPVACAAFEEFTLKEEG